MDYEAAKKTNRLPKPPTQKNISSYGNKIRAKKTVS